MKTKITGIENPADTLIY